jgi:hypothetical protein
VFDYKEALKKPTHPALHSLESGSLKKAVSKPLGTASSPHSCVSPAYFLIEATFFKTV